MYILFARNNSNRHWSRIPRILHRFASDLVPSSIYWNNIANRILHRLLIRPVHHQRIHSRMHFHHPRLAQIIKSKPLANSNSAAMAANLNASISNVKVSSVLNNDIKSFGKQFLLDGSYETCWNSDKGSPQFIAIKLSKHLLMTGFDIMFQGGFAPKSIKIGDFEFHPLNSNSLQTFTFPNALEQDRLLVEFPESWDLFGRIIVYHFNLF
jgi:hypothetical protein